MKPSFFLFLSILISLTVSPLLPQKINEDFSCDVEAQGENKSTAIGNCWRKAMLQYVQDNVHDNDYLNHAKPIEIWLNLSWKEYALGDLMGVQVVTPYNSQNKKIKVRVRLAGEKLLADLFAKFPELKRKKASAKTPAEPIVKPNKPVDQQQPAHNRKDVRHTPVTGRGKGSTQQSAVFQAVYDALKEFIRQKIGVDTFVKHEQKIVKMLIEKGPYRYLVDPAQINITSPWSETTRRVTITIVNNIDEEIILADLEQIVPGISQTIGKQNKPQTGKITPITARGKSTSKSGAETQAWRSALLECVRQLIGAEQLARHEAKIIEMIMQWGRYVKDRDTVKVTQPWSEETRTLVFVVQDEIDRDLLMSDLQLHIVGKSQKLKAATMVICRRAQPQSDAQEYQIAYAAFTDALVQNGVKCYGEEHLQNDSVNAAFIADLAVSIEKITVGTDCMISARIASKGESKSNGNILWNLDIKSGQRLDDIFVPRPQRMMMPELEQRMRERAIQEMAAFVAEQVMKRIAEMEPADDSSRPEQPGQKVPSEERSAVQPPESGEHQPGPRQVPDRRKTVSILVCAETSTHSGKKGDTTVQGLWLNLLAKNGFEVYSPESLQKKIDKLRQQKIDPVLMEQMAFHSVQIVVRYSLDIDKGPQDTRVRLETEGTWKTTGIELWRFQERLTAYSQQEAVAKVADIAANKFIGYINQSKTFSKDTQVLKFVNFSEQQRKQIETAITTLAQKKPSQLQLVKSSGSQSGHMMLDMWVKWLNSRDSQLQIMETLEKACTENNVPVFFLAVAPGVLIADGSNQKNK